MTSKSIASAIKSASELLSAAGIENSYNEAKILMEHCLKVSNKELLLILHDALSLENEKKYFNLIAVRKKRYPLQYIIEEQEFMGRRFKVSPAVLIPRRETEELVERVLKSSIPKNALVVDVGTGSGAIAVSLAKERPDLCVLAVDIKEEILDIAGENAQRHSADVIFFKGNLLEPLLKKNIKVDVIVTNLPYVPENEIDNLQPEVMFEPREALVGGKNGLDYYRKLINQSREVFKAEGKFFLEISPHQASQVSRYLADAGYRKINIIKDLQNRERIVYASWGGKLINYDYTIY